MKKLLIICFCLIAFQSKSQLITKTFEKKGNIYIQYDNAETKQLTSKGIDSQPILSSDKSFVIYLRTIKNTSKVEEGDEVIDETKIIQYDFKTSLEKVLVQGCRKDGKGSSPIAYADSDNYPFTGLCNISLILLSPDNRRVYFQTTAWAVANAIHYYNIPANKIGFCHSGDLEGILPDGNLKISITDTEKNKGRYYQQWLFDKNGNPIKAIGEKEF